MPNNRIYSVYYRTGGTENFKWQCTLEQYDYCHAADCVQELRDSGYVAYYMRSDMLEAVGLPKTYDYSGSTEELIETWISNGDATTVEK